MERAEAINDLKIIKTFFEEQSGAYPISIEYAIKELENHVEVARCKECKYEPICTHSVQHTTYEPTSVTIEYKSVDSCSYGEREGE